VRGHHLHSQGHAPLLRQVQVAALDGAQERPEYLGRDGQVPALGALGVPDPCDGPARRGANFDATPLRCTEQDGDAMPGAAGDFGGRHPELSQSETAAWRRSQGRRPGGERCWAGVRACLRASVQTSL